MVRLYFLLLLAISFLQPATLQACGYGFIGGCSTNIGLRINGTVDSFAIAPCANITDFHGLRLGLIQSLSLVRAKSINWESCQNNVTAVTIYFRVFQTGMPGGAWQTVSLQEDYNTLVGPYTTRYRSADANVNLTAGLLVGKDYTLEAYFQAQVDTIGNDFLPETSIVQDNNGLNYRLTFRYGGPAAPPFTVVNTRKIEPSCYGDTTGSLRVSVYGNQTDLFYHWSYAQTNFHTLYNLPAGTYMVTVTGMGGYSQADTVLLGQPQSINNQFINLIPFGCNGNTAQVTAQASGGTGPYSYQWSNGSPTAVITVTTPGNYTVTVTDTHNCTRSFTQPISSGNGMTVLNIQTDICSGETYRIGNQSFVQPGSYDITITSATNCDTLIHLQLGVLNPGALLANLPTAGTVTCTQPGLSLCATTQPNAAFSWKKDNFTLANTPCVLATAGGVYTLTATLAGTANKVCPAEKTVVIEEHLSVPVAIITGQFMTGCVPSSVPTWLHAVTNAQNPSYLWTYNDQTLSMTDSCPFVFAGWTGQGSLVVPNLVVTDAYGCSTSASNATSAVQNGNAPILNLYEQNLCNGQTEISYDIIGGTLPYQQLAWNDPNILTNPFTVPAGLYIATVTDAAGCISIFTITVSPFSLTTAVQMATGPNIANGMATVNLNGGSPPYFFQWSNGNTTQQISNQLPGSYCVTATDSDGCTQDTCLVISYPSAVREPEVSKIGIVPNPVTPGDWLELHLPAQLVGEKVDIEIFDTVGRIWWREHQTANTGILQVLLPAQTPAGLLLVRVRSAAVQAVGRCMAR